MTQAYKDKTPEQKAAFNSYCIERWKRRKRESVDYKGGKCYDCGYDRCVAALEFHHLDPSEKEMNWQKLRLVSESRLYQELDKCVLLCANCHRERHHPDT